MTPRTARPKVPREYREPPAKLSDAELVFCLWDRRKGRGYRIAVRREVERRLLAASSVVAVDAPAIRAVVDRWFATQMRTHHPDRGGVVAVAQAIAAARDALLDALAQAGISGSA